MASIVGRRPTPRKAALPPEARLVAQGLAGPRAAPQPHSLAGKLRPTRRAGRLRVNRWRPAMERQGWWALAAVVLLVLTVVGALLLPGPAPVMKLELTGTPGIKVEGTCE